MTTFLPRKARVGLLAGGLALVAGSAATILPAGAQVSPTLTVVPAVIAVGESADLIATGCVQEGTAQEDLYVVFSSGEGGPGTSEPVATDAEGTATYNTGNAPEGAEGVYPITATCVADNGEGFDVVFEYEVASLTVVGETTTTTAAPTTTAPAAAAAATVTPAFTG
jgi:hypothetical protein